jgi:hypothetical protein
LRLFSISESEETFIIPKDIGSFVIFVIAAAFFNSSYILAQTSQLLA